MRGHAHRTGTRSAAAVRDGEGLVQVEVHEVEAQVAGADDAEQGVQVGAIAVHQAAAVVDQLDDLFDVLVEETERVRVGQHHADDGIVTGGFERLQIHIAALVGRDLHNAHAHHADRGRVGAMGGIRDEHLGALVIAA